MKSPCLCCAVLFFSTALACSFPDLTPNAPTAAPANLRLVAGSPPTLAWDAVPGAGAYAVFRSCVCNQWPECCDKETFSTSIAVTEDGYYTVAAESRAGGLVGPRAVSPVLLGAPAAPQNVHIEKVGMQHFLQWNPVLGATSYVIYRSVSDLPVPFPPAPPFDLVAASINQYFVAGPGFCYWVAARAADGSESPIGMEDVTYF